MDKIIFVDYENIKNFMSAECSELSKRDKIIVFTSKNSSKIPFDLLKIILDTSVTLEIEIITTSGRNELDFALVAYLGRLVGSKIKREYYVISHDKGFKAAIRHLSKHAKIEQHNKIDKIFKNYEIDLRVVSD